MPSIYDQLLDSQPTAPGAAPPAGNPYDNLLQQEDDERRKRLQLVLQDAVKTSPEAAASAQQLAKQTGLPVATVERNLEEVRQRALVQRINTQRLQASSPVLARQLMDPEFAKLAHDDIDSMVEAERTLGGFAQDVGVTALKGAVGLPQAFVGLASLATGGYAGKGLEALGVRFNDTQDILNTWYSSAQQRANQRVQEADGFFNTLGAMAANPSTIATTVGESLPQMIGGAGIARGLLGLGAKGVAAGMMGPELPGILSRVLGSAAPRAAGAVGEGAVGAGSAAEQFRADNPDQLLTLREAIAATLSGAMTGGLSMAAGGVAQRLGIEDVDVALAGGRMGVTAENADKGLLRQMLESVLTEGVLEELPQSAQEQMWQNIGEGKPLFEGVGNAAAMGLVAGAVTGVGFNAAARAIDSKSRSSLMAELNAQRLEQLNKIMAANKVLQRDPDAVERFAEQATEQGVKDFYLDAQTLAQSGLLGELAAASPAIAEQLASPSPKGVLHLSVAEYTARVAGTELAPRLVDHIRVGDPDEFSRVEAQEYMQTQMQNVEAEVAKVLDLKADDITFRESYQKVKKAVLDRLNELGSFAPHVNEFYAAQQAAYAAARASRLGVTPEQFYQDHLLRIESERGVGPQYDQPQGNRAAGWTEQRVDRLLKDYGIKHLPNRAQAYAVMMSPQDFLGLTASQQREAEIAAETVPLNPAALAAEDQEIYLDIERNKDGTFSVVSHEGRHRMTALARAGVTQVPVVLNLGSAGRGELTALAEAQLAPQRNGQRGATVTNLQPMSYANRDALLAMGGQDVMFQSVSSRVPTAKPRGKNPIPVEDHLSNRLQVGLAAFKGVPDAFAKAVDLVTSYVNWRPNPELTTPEEKAEAFIKEVMGNLLWLHDQVPANIRARSKLWYDGANVIADMFATRYGITLAQASAVLAVNSPQTEWFTNVSRAERILDIWFNQQNSAWSPEMEATANRILAKEQYAEDLAAIKGKTLAQLNGNVTQQAMWLRVYDESHNNRQYRIVTPEGTFGDYVTTDSGAPGTAAWASFLHIAKSIEVLQDGSLANVSAALGNAHKVRSFYNNIFDPNDPVGDVTIDTHAVAAALLRPLSGSSIEVEHNLGAGVTNALMGLSGTYGIFAEAYRRAAAERGILPRELQSITWEAIRGLYPAELKRASLKAEIQQAWEEFKSGKIDEAAVRARVLKLAGGIDEPNWWQSNRRPPTSTWSSSYGGVLSRVRVSRPATGTAAGGNPAGSGRGSGGGQAAQGNGQVLNQTAGAPRLATWFSGGRTLEGAAENIESVMAVENDADINGFANTAWGTEFSTRGVEEIDPQELIDADVTLFHASPVCKNFSAAKTLRGATELDRKSAEAIARAIREALPPVVTVENVPEYRNTALFKLITDALDDAGYTYEVIVHNATDFGGAQSRERMLLRAVREGDLPPVPAKIQPGDWMQAIGDLLEDAPTDKIPPEERRRLDDMIAKGKLDPTRPIITMGGSGFKGTWAAANDGGPAPTLKSANEKPRVIMPDGTVRVVTPRMMARLMGLPDSFQVPDSRTFAKTVLGNGIHGSVTRALIVPLLQKYHQGQQEQANRGSFNPALNLITLLQDADLSTFLHESAHYFFETDIGVVQALLAKPELTPGEQQIVDDVSALLKWHGLEGTPAEQLAQWNAMSFEEKRVAHERTAEAYEAYLFEGKAPSLELESAFRAFTTWMKRVYTSIRDFLTRHPEAGKLNDEIRQVFDRMLATDEQIRIAEAAREMVPLFASEEELAKMGLDPAAYQLAQLAATQASMEYLAAKGLKDMKWLSNARGKELKRLQREVADLRAKMREQVEAEVLQRPVYQAIRWLTKGVLVRDGEEVKAEKGFRLNTATVKAMYPDSMLSKPDLKRLRGMTGPEGLEPDMVAEMFGFASGDALIRAIVEATPMKEEVDGLTDQRMLETYGDLTTQEGLEREADKAVHTELRARVLATESNALDKALGRPRMLAKAAKLAAERTVSKLLVKAVRPKQYGAAEAKAGRAAAKAFKAGDIKTAADEKRRQLFNNYAAKAAYEAQDEVRAILKFFRHIASLPDQKAGKTRNMDVVAAARAILADHGYGQRTKGALEYLKAVEAYDPQTYQALVEMIADAGDIAPGKPVEEMTVEELRALHDEVKFIWNIAKRTQEVIVDGERRQREDLANELADRLEELGAPAEDLGKASAVTPAEERALRLSSAKAWLRRVEHWVEMLDGSKMGIFRRYVFQPIKEAADRYRADKIIYLRAFRDAFDGIGQTMQKGLINAYELGYTFGKDEAGVGMNELLHAILHTGNESNKRKLLLGRGWAVENEDGTLDTSRWDAFLQRMVDEGVLTREHFDFAQKVWDLLEQTKPLAQKAHRDAYGKYFSEVTANEFTVQFPDGSAVYRGGYVPAMTDARIVKDAELKKLVEEGNDGVMHAFPGAAKGFTKSRVEYNRPLLLDLRTLPQHIDRVLLFSHLEMPVRDAGKLLANRRLAGTLNRYDAGAISQMLMPWLNRTARQQVTVPVAGAGWMARWINTLRNRTSLASMFANVSNALQQVTGFAMAAVKVKPSHLASAMAHYLKNPKAMAETVAANSVYMSHRMENEVDAMMGEVDKILLDPTTYEQTQEWVKRHQFFLQSAVDNVMGPVIWTGAYNEALEEGYSHKDAVRIADSVIRTTQGSTLPEDVSSIEVQNAFLRVFLQFAGYFNMQANMLGAEFGKIMRNGGLRMGMGRGLYVFTMGFLAPAMVAELIAQAFKGGPGDDDKDGEYLDDWLMALLVYGPMRNGTAFVPGAGQLVNSAVARFNSNPTDDRVSTAPAVSMLESAAGVPYDLYREAVDRGNHARTIKDLATLITLTTGLPANTLARPISYLAGVEQGKVQPTSAGDATRGLVTGTASPESRVQ